jgi:multiple sugar transport system ATP-binding protein
LTAIGLNEVTKVFGDGTTAVDKLSLEAEDGEFLVLLGPSGCGKSTALRMIAGLEEITSGELYLDGELANDLPPRERNIAMVFQSFALYPYMNVRDNIAFPLRIAKTPKHVIDERVAGVATALGIGDHLDRKPGQLSGGQRQRVAMARAIVRRPSLFLMDEPLSNLDAGLRVELRTEITNLSRDLGVTTLYVTHDQTEALTMADRIAVMRNGVLQQVDTPDRVYDDPATVFVAAFLGTPRMNLLEATVHAYLDEHVILDLGTQAIGLPWHDPRARPLARHHAERVIVGLRSEALELVSPDTSPIARPLLRGTVHHREHLGHETLAYVETGARTIELNINRPIAVNGHGVRAQSTALGRLAKATIGRFRQEEDAGYEREDLLAQHRAGAGHRYRPAELAVRVAGGRSVRPGEAVTLAVDTQHLYVFDRTGHRITAHGFMPQVAAPPAFRRA